MRYALVLLIATPAVAAPKRAPSKSVTLTAPKRVDLSALGTFREVESHGDIKVAATGAVASDAPDVEHGPAAEVRRDAPAQVSDGALQALAERQMRRNVDSIDACVAEEQKRNPRASGTLTLQITVVERKLGNLFIADDTLRSQPLADCLNKAAQGWSFSLKAAEFGYPISVGRRR